MYTHRRHAYIYILYMHARTCMSARMVMVHACMHANRHTDIHRQTGRDRLRQSMCVCVCILLATSVGVLLEHVQGVFVGLGSALFHSSVPSRLRVTLCPYWLISGLLPLVLGSTNVHRFLGKKVPFVCSTPFNVASQNNSRRTPICQYANTLEYEEIAPKIRCPSKRKDMDR